MSERTTAAMSLKEMLLNNKIVSSFSLILSIVGFAGIPDDLANLYTFAAYAEPYINNGWVRLAFILIPLSAISYCILMEHRDARVRSGPDTFRSTSLPLQKKQNTSFDYDKHILDIEFLTAEEGKKNLTDKQRFEQSGGVVVTGQLERRHPVQVFVYGSLLCPPNMQRTIGRNPNIIEYVPATLKGYRLEWKRASPSKTLVNSNFEREPEDISWSGLVAVKDETKTISGAIVEVSSEELERLKSREKTYAPQRIPINQFEYSKSSGINADAIFAFFDEIEPQSIDDHARSPSSAIRTGHLKGLKASINALGLPDTLPDTKQISLRDAFDPDQALLYRWLSNENSLPTLERDLHNNLLKYTNIDGLEYFIPTAVRPLLISKTLFEHSKTVAENALKVSLKALKLALDRPEFTAWMDTAEEDLELAKILFRNEPCLLPEVCRFDMVVTGGNVRILELNSDSPGGAFHLDFLSQIQGEHCKQFEIDQLGNSHYKLCDDMIAAFRSAWVRYSKKTGRSSIRGIAIVDWNPKDWNTYPEMKHFQSEFQREFETPCFVCDPRELMYDQAENVIRHAASGTPIDLIHKRILVQDFLRDETKPSWTWFVEAVKNEAACIVNNWAGRLAGNKAIFAILKNPDFETWLRERGETLSQGEREVIQTHIPDTQFWNTSSEGIYERVMANPQKYVLKSAKGYGGQEVFFGHQRGAKAKFEQFYNGYYIVQERLPHGRVKIPLLDGGKVIWKYMNYVMDAYVIDGKCTALEAKVSHSVPVGMRVVDGKPAGFRTAVFSTR